MTAGLDWSVGADNVNPGDRYTHRFILDGPYLLFGMSLLPVHGSNKIASQSIKDIGSHCNWSSIE